MTGELVTAAIGNTHWRDNLAYLHGDAGDVTLSSSATTLDLPATSARIQMGAGGYTFVGAEADNGAYLAANAYFASGAWNLLNSLQAAWLVEVLRGGGGDSFNIYRSPSGSVSWATLFAIDSNGQISTNDGMHVHRHPYSSRRHVESGNLSVATGAGTSVTYTDAFSVAPLPVVSVQSVAVIGGYASPGTTGFTIKHNSGSTETMSWLVEGADA